MPWPKVIAALLTPLVLTLGILGYLDTAEDDWPW